MTDLPGNITLLACTVMVCLSVVAIVLCYFYYQSLRGK